MQLQLAEAQLATATEFAAAQEVKARKDVEALTVAQREVAEWKEEAVEAQAAFGSIKVQRNEAHLELASLQQLLAEAQVVDGSVASRHSSRRSPSAHSKHSESFARQGLRRSTNLSMWREPPTSLRRAAFAALVSREQFSSLTGPECAINISGRATT